ncbi:hypothetical protein IMSAGC019_01291 [Lachnospiraceae bacterium]|nr:hypothetical protein IMSAGC019_01291 [Lachnospiraceae bacterium]
MRRGTQRQEFYKVDNCKTDVGKKGRNKDGDVNVVP